MKIAALQERQGPRAARGRALSEMRQTRPHKKKVILANPGEPGGVAWKTRLGRCMIGAMPEDTTPHRCLLPKRPTRRRPRRRPPPPVVPACKPVALDRRRPAAPRSCRDPGVDARPFPLAVCLLLVLLPETRMDREWRGSKSPAPPCSTRRWASTRSGRWACSPWLGWFALSGRTPHGGLARLARAWRPGRCFPAQPAAHPAVAGLLAQLAAGGADHLEKATGSSSAWPVRGWWAGAGALHRARSRWRAWRPRTFSPPAFTALLAPDLLAIAEHAGAHVARPMPVRPPEPERPAHAPDAGNSSSSMQALWEHHRRGSARQPAGAGQCLRAGVCALCDGRDVFPARKPGWSRRCSKNASAPRVA